MRQLVKNSLRKKKHHTIISGYGRSGTTFLIQLLSNLGENTGYTELSAKNDIELVSRAGLEKNIFDLRAPYFIKDPHLCGHFDEVLGDKKIVVDELWVPVRDSLNASDSRKRINNLDKQAGGGLWDTSMEKDQEFILLKKLNTLLVSASKATIPILFLNFPLLVTDSSYLYSKISHRLNIEFEDFDKVYTSLSNTELIHFR